MRILITGGAGFIGTRIVEAARARGDEVRVLDSFRDDVHGGTPVLHPDVEVIRGDVRDAEVLDRALRGVDAVSHQAAKVGLGVDFADAPDYVSSNVLATAELLAAMRRARVGRLVLASSMVVYGEGRDTSS
ncbi:MAG TPA: NAD-dependent dehydratase, partial [Microbacterium sp.]|nr:NAD-dependent dehydratase [Microbacterium sp.]